MLRSFEDLQLLDVVVAQILAEIGRTGRALATDVLLLDNEQGRKNTGVLGSHIA